MNTNTLSRWRNLGIIAHIDAGKTTLTERLLWAAGAIHRLGEVHDGAATTDFSDIERARGISIGAAAVQVQWAPAGQPTHRLTLIDTPGHIDFAIEVERSLRVLDGAVAVFSAVDGVQPQSETVWRQARRHGVPMLAFVNKMDRAGASFDGVLAQLRSKLDATVWAVGVPLPGDSGFDGWSDLVGGRLLTWDDEGQLHTRAWHAEEAAAFAEAREQLIAAVAEHDEALAQAYLEERAIDAELLRGALRRATLAGAGVPVLAGSAFKRKGIEPLLDAIVDWLPSPLDRPPVAARADADGDADGEGGHETLLAPDPSGPLAALVFKFAHTAQGPLAFVRVYSGTLRVGDTVWTSHARRPRRVGRLAVVQAQRTHDVAQAEAGEIVAVLGWKDAVSGETLSGVQARWVLERIRTQPPVLAWRLGAANAAELVRLGQGLARLAQEDPSFRVDSDPETGEAVIWGMGELHLEVMVERLRSEWHVDVRTGAPRVAYQETPRAAALGVAARLSKQNGGQGQFAQVVLDVLPRADGAVIFADRSRGGVVPKAFVAATEKGARAALAQGPLGHPVVGVEVVLVDGQAHAVDSSDLAFQRAASDAVKAALAQVGTQLLEPVMAVAIDTPAHSVGDVLGDLQRREGRVVAIEERGARAEVVAQAPLAQLQAYATALRSLTQGRASASMTFDGYAPVKAA
ncbi:elongation factor G [Xanthomonas sacchari]|uniref:elongation factor G n=1 Tax=unclassified Xanthomonas TaxID=2643310 RepID=UPI00136E8B43|nr:MULTISPECIES: elongation factor G [unclassified Xanthomonas]MBB6366902.1 elongation factor G [Xanthomonas sp. F10]MXV34004.1 elongation factor G [Xanthomonas sp. LMG 8989]